MRWKYKLDKERKRKISLDGQYMLEIPCRNDIHLQQQITALYVCIKKLAEADRALIILFLEDLSYREISAIAGITENHVAVKIKRIRAKLFNCLNQ